MNIDMIYIILTASERIVKSHKVFSDWLPLKFWPDFIEIIPRYNIQAVFSFFGAIQLLRNAPGGSTRCDTLWEGEGGRPSVT